MAQKINIRVFYPETEAGMVELDERIAQMQADAMIMSINKLEITREEKLKLLARIKESVE